MLNKNVMEALDVFVMGILFFFIANEVNFSTKMKIKFHVSVCLLYFMYIFPITNIHERKIQQTEEI